MGASNQAAIPPSMPGSSLNNFRVFQIGSPNGSDTISSTASENIALLNAAAKIFEDDVIIAKEIIGYYQQIQENVSTMGTCGAKRAQIVILCEDINLRLSSYKVGDDTVPLLRCVIKQQQRIQYAIYDITVLFLLQGVWKESHEDIKRKNILCALPLEIMKLICVLGKMYFDFQQKAKVEQDDSFMFLCDEELHDNEIRECYLEVQKEIMAELELCSRQLGRILHFDQDYFYHVKHDSLHRTCLKGLEWLIEKKIDLLRAKQDTIAAAQHFPAGPSGGLRRQIT